MRNAGIALSLCLIAGVSCQSSSKPSPDGAVEPPPPQPGDAITEQPTASVSSGAQGDFLAREAQLLNLQVQKNQVLVAAYLDLAEERIARSDFGEAEKQLQLALSIDPDNAAIHQKLAEVRALQGEGQSQYTLLTEDLGAATEIKVQQLRAAAKENLEKGKLAMERGEFEAAIQEFSLANDYVRWAPVAIDWQGVDQDAPRLLSEARAGREKAREEDRLTQEREATDRIRAEEQAKNELDQARINTLLAQSVAAFDAEAYDTSRAFAERVLRLDPKNEKAQEISDAAFQAGLERSNTRFIQSKRERFQEWELSLDNLTVPNTGVLQLPSIDEWNSLTALRQRRTNAAEMAAADPLDEKLKQQIKDTRLPGLVVRDVESLSEVAQQLNAVSGIDIVVDPAAEEAVVGEGVVFDLPFGNPIGMRDLLDNIASQSGESVVWTVQFGAVFFTTAEKARGELALVNHDISDLTTALPNFVAPRLDRLRLFEELEDDDGGGPFGGIADPSVRQDSDALTELVKANVRPTTWEQEGVSVNAFNDTTLIVRHTAEVQREVERFLEELRRFNSMIVTIDTRFLSVEDNYLQEIGVDWRGLDNPGTPFTDLDDVTNGLEDDASLGLDNGGSGTENGNQAGNPSAGFYYDDGGDGDFKASTSNYFKSPLGNALSTVGGLTAEFNILDDANLNFLLTAIEKSSKIQVVNTQTVSVFNSQQAAVSVVNQRAYIQDFDVEVATGISIADPVINVLSEGVSLQVTPIVAHDRQNLTLEVQPTVAKVVALVPFATNLANSVGSPVEFVLPELKIQSLKTTASIPDGGTILIGGLSRISNVERRAEVPWLANIPLIGFFFKQEGTSDERSSLMILMKAKITDIREEVANLK
jgi:Flp pilus assembly secretin CpaC/tetratricopeptide (TPR) repeat protein